MQEKKAIAKERSYCNFDHIQSVSAYCNACASYICEDCQIASHFNHDMVNLEFECFKKFSEYKSTAYNVKVMLKQYDKALSGQSIDESLSSLTSKVNSLFNELIESILAYKEKVLKELFESKEVQDAIKERSDSINVNMQILQQISADAESLLASIQEELNNKRHILIHERDAETELKPLQDRLREWKQKSATNPLKIQDLEQDLCIDCRPSDAKLKNFVNLSYRSHPSQQSLYKLNEYTNMLLLHNFVSRNSSLVKIDTTLHVPYHYSSAVLGSRIYFVGGDDDGYRKDCYAVPLDYGVLLWLEDLHTERRGHAVVPFHAQQLLFAVGGYNKTQGILDSVERYDPEADQWTDFPPMLNKRQWPGACQFNSQYLYCFGAFKVDVIERIDITEGKSWEAVALAKKPEEWRAFSACVAIQVSPNEVLIMGGCHEKDSDRVFMYNHKAKTLAAKTTMPVPSLFCQAIPVVSGSRIAVIGWRNEILYIYDTAADKWTLVDPAEYQVPEFTKQ